jgi:hypothetical protein
MAADLNTAAEILLANHLTFLANEGVRLRALVKLQRCGFTHDEAVAAVSSLTMRKAG